MDFEFDSAKNELNLAKHHLELSFGALIFLDPFRIEWQDNRQDYGEIRIVTIGVVESYLFSVLYTRRGADQSVIRIISVRRASKNERAHYQRIKQNG